MKTAIFPGSLDPVALGHLDIIERVNRLSDRPIVVILENLEKHATSSMEERLTFLRNNIAYFSDVEVAADHSSTVDFARRQEVVATVRGVRSVKDYEYELDIANVNQYIASKVEIVLLYASPGFSCVSSSTTRELVKYGQDISAYVPKDVMETFVNR